MEGNLNFDFLLRQIVPPERTKKANTGGNTRGAGAEEWAHGEGESTEQSSNSNDGLGVKEGGAALNAEDEAGIGQPPTKKQKLKTEKTDKKASRFKDPKGCGATNLQTYRYPDFCGVLGKKIKRMNAILNERNNEKL